MYYVFSSSSLQRNTNNSEEEEKKKTAIDCDKSNLFSIRFVKREKKTPIFLQFVPDSWMKSIPHRTDHIHPTSKNIVALCKTAARRLYKHATIFFS